LEAGCPDNNTKNTGKYRNTMAKIQGNIGLTGVGKVTLHAMLAFLIG